MKYFGTSSTQNVESKNVPYGRKHNKFCKDLETVPLGEKMSTESAVLSSVCTELCFTKGKIQLCSEAETKSTHLICALVASTEERGKDGGLRSAKSTAAGQSLLGRLYRTSGRVVHLCQLFLQLAG